MAAATLLCKQCNFENEPERVYCHNCGAKLDRTLLPPEAIRREDPQAVQDRVRSVVRPRRVAAVPVLRNLLISLAAAAVLAALFLIFKAPEVPPRLSDEAAMTAPPISDNLEELVESPSPRRLTFTQEQVNGFLQATLRAKDESTYGITAKYERTFVRFQEGLCRVTVQEAFFGHPFYFSTTDAVEIRGGRLITHPAAGSIGSLPIPGKLMPMVEKALSPVWAALDTYKKQVARLGSIAFQKGTVSVAGNSAAAANAP
jgi:hypothetical protein